MRFQALFLFLSLYGFGLVNCVRDDTLHEGSLLDNGGRSDILEFAEEVFQDFLRSGENGKTCFL